MGKNKKESLIFTTIMCALMVLGMTVYNVLLLKGFTADAFKTMAIGYVPAFVVALLLDLFVVGVGAKNIAGRLVKPGSPMIRKVLTISFCMVLGMVVSMSLYGAVTHVGFGPELGAAYVRNLWLNFICALPLQLVVVGPLTRAVFFKLFPPQASSRATAA